MSRKTNLKRSSRVPEWFKPRICTLALLAAAGTVDGKANPLLPLHAHSMISQGQMAVKVKGRVIDEKGEGMPGVTILVKGKSNGTATNPDGTYTIEVPSPNDILVFSFVGYLTKEITVGSQSTINVQLEADSKALDELVVVGYGTVKKSDLTGSVSTLQVSDMVKAPVGNFADALAGRAAGVRVMSNDGQPGGGVEIMIRGAGSLTQSTSPLYVIDDFPVEDFNPSTLSPEDIESISILKDASSASVYGSRAANGVVLIKTKRGKAGRPEITLSTSIGFQGQPEKKELMSPYEFLKYQMEMNPTSATTLAYFRNGKTLEDYRNVKGIDFQDLVFRTGAIKNYGVSIRGGNDQTKYSVSGSIFDQKGVIINTGYNRYSGRVTLDQKLAKNIDAGVTVNYTGVKKYGQQINASAGNASPSTYTLFRTWVYRPVAPIGEDINLVTEEADESAVNNSDFRVNPFIDLENQHQVNMTSTVDGNAFVRVKLAEGLTFKTIGGLRHARIVDENFFNSKTSQGSPYNPLNVNGVNGSITNTYSYLFSNENTLNYNKEFGLHRFDAFALFGLNGTTRSQNGYGGRLLPNEELGIDGLDQGVPYNPRSWTSKNTMVSYAGRIDYGFASKYLLTLTFRADGSSKFLNPWGYFPGAAVGWNLDKENFFRQAFPVLSTTKLRASYGSTGNNRVNDFDRFAALSQVLSGYSFNNSTPLQAVQVSSVGNMNLRWEKVNTTDIGLELGAFKDRILLEVDVYNKITSDLLLNAALPTSTGFSTAYKNIGKLRNRGLEVTLNTANVETRDFTWNSNFNISFNRNTIMELTYGQQSVLANGRYESHFNKPLYMSEIGKPAGQMIGFIWEGNYQFEDFHNPSAGVYILKDNIPSNGSVRNTIQPGDIKYRDMNGDGTIDDNDMTIIGRGQPLHTGGFNNNLRYKNLSLNVFFQWAYGNHIYNANRLALEGNSNMRVLVNQYASYVNRWSPENPTNENYRSRGQGVIGLYSSKNVEDGSYLRMKTVSLDYSLPKTWINKAYLKSLVLSVAAQNLLTWTKYSGLDPEVSTLSSAVLSPGFDFSGYPQAKTITFGVKAVF
ncbi:TonB-dependent receptor [Ravibacter arvi]|uniref:TonB-dependent receptor n=1 Tax=Ravibacter arvi TaxID=2051041 RepID=A0ABP8LQI1_9BACT